MTEIVIVTDATSVAMLTGRETVTEIETEIATTEEDEVPTVREATASETDAALLVRRGENAN